MPRIPKKVVKYIIVWDSVESNFEKEVNKYLEMGYQPWGSATSAGTRDRAFIYQPMVKYTVDRKGNSI